MEEGGGCTLAPGAEGGKEGEKGSHRIGVMKRLRAACIDGSRGLEPHDDVTSHFPRGLLFFFFFVPLFYSIFHSAVWIFVSRVKVMFRDDDDRILC